MEGRDRRWRGAIAGEGERSQVEGSDRRWRGRERSQGKGRDRRWRGGIVITEGSNVRYKSKKLYLEKTISCSDFPKNQTDQTRFSSPKRFASLLSLNRLEYVQLMGARRNATRRRADAACPPCKSKQARCSDFRPCARCSQLGGKSCTDGVNKYSVRPTSSLVSKQV